MSEEVQFPYVSYKGKKYADPHAAAKAFFLDTTKTPTDRLNIHDISDTSSIDGAGVDRNGKVWVNTESFQSHPEMINLKTAMRDVFESIREVMKRDNATLEEVAQEPLNVRPYYSYKGKRYETPQEVFTEFHNDPNKVQHVNSVMYHNRFDYGGIELAGVGQNDTTWYTQLSDYANVPAVKAGRAIFEQTKQDTPEINVSNNLQVETPTVSAPVVERQGIILDANNPIIDKKDYDLEQIRSNFPVHFSYKDKAYLHAEDAMKAFLDTPKDERAIGSGVMLHTRYIGGGFEMAGQTHMDGQKLWVDRLGNNDHVPEVVAARKVMNEMLNEHNLKNQPVEPTVAPAIKVEKQGIVLDANNPIISQNDYNQEQLKNDFPVHFSFQGNAYLNAKDAMKAFLDTPEDQRGIGNGVTLHTKDPVIGYQMAGQNDIHNLLWVDRLSDHNHIPEVVAARKVMNEMLNEHNLKNQPIEPTVAPAVKVEKQGIVLDANNPIISQNDYNQEQLKNDFPVHFSFQGNAYLHAEDAMKAFLDTPKDQRGVGNGVTLHTKDPVIGYQMAGQNNIHDLLWVDRLGDHNHIPEVVAARKVMNKMLDEHNLKNQPVVEVNPLNAENAIMTKKDFYSKLDSKGAISEPHYSFGDNVYLNAKDAMKAFLDTPKEVRETISGGVMLHTKDIFGGYQMAGQTLTHGQQVWVDRLGDHDHIPEVVAARKVMNPMLKEYNLKNQPIVEVNPLNVENAVMTKKDFYSKLDSKGTISEPHYSFGDNVYLNAKDAMKAFLDTPKEVRETISGGVMLHTKDIFGGYQMAGQTLTHGQQVWVDRLGDHDHIPEVVAARKVMNPMLKEYNLNNQPVEPAIVKEPKVTKSVDDDAPRIMINAENPIVSRKDLDYGAISNSAKFPIHYSYGDKAYLHAKDAMEAFMNDPDKKPNQNGVTLHNRYTTSGVQMTGVGPNNELWVDNIQDNNTVPAIVSARAVMNKMLDDAKPKDEINFTSAIEPSKQPEFPYFKYDNKVYSSASDVMKVFIADRDNNAIKSDVHLHIDNHFTGVDAAGHDRNGNVWKNQYSFQDHPAMQDFKKSFDKEVNSYKAHLQYLDSVYADTAKVVEGYPVSVQIEDMKEMKKIIDKLPVNNVSDTDMLRIQSYKNDIKNHELSVFLDNGTKNDVKVKQNMNLKIS